MTRVDPALVDEVVGRGEPGRRTRTVVVVGTVLFVLLSVLATRTVPHPVGPARTYGKYRGKAVTTARAAESDVETVLLAAQAASAGHSFGPYVSIVVSDAEDALSGVQGTFDSIQSPDARGDALGRRLDMLLSDALDHARSVRVAARRGDLAALADVARPLVADSKHLSSFIASQS